MPIVSVIAKSLSGVAEEERTGPGKERLYGTKEEKYINPDSFFRNNQEENKDTSKPVNTDQTQK